MQRRYISAVKPLEGHILQVDFVSGSRMLLDLKPFLAQLRFPPADQTGGLAERRDTNGRVRPHRARVELSHDEIFELAERPGQEALG